MEILNYIQITFVLIFVCVVTVLLWDFLLEKFPFKWSQIKHKSRHSIPKEDRNSHLTKKKNTLFMWEEPQNESVYNKLKARVEAKKNNER